MEGIRIEIIDEMKVRVTDKKSGEWMQKESVEVVLQFAILEKLEEIRCGIIDVENSVERN